MSDAPPAEPEEYEFAPMPVEAVPPPPTVFEPPPPFAPPFAPPYAPPFASGMPLAYGSARTMARPGGLTAVGILSVVIGVMSLLCSGTFGMWDYSMVIFSRLPRSMASAPAVVPVAAASPGSSAVGTTTAPTAAPAMAAAAGAGLTPLEEQAVMNRIAQLAGRLTAAQRVTILQNLRASQQLIIPGASAAGPASQVRSATILADGSVMVQTQATGNSALLVVARNGVVTTFTSSRWSSTGSFTTNSVSSGGGATKPGFGFAGRRMSSAPALTAVAITAVNIALAIFLIVCGVMMLRNVAQARRLHLVYAGVKVPVALAAAGATAWLWSSFISMFTGTAWGPGGSRGSVMVTVAMAPALLGCIYPIALWCVMESRSVREWYAGE
jgi:hypothetical protein